MRASRFFRLVWRANALVIFLAGILASAVALFALAFIWREQTRTHEVRGVVNIAGAEVQQERYRLGNFERLKHVHLLRAALTSEQEYDQVAFSKSASATRNYLFFDPATHKSRWLLPSNDQVFLVDDDLFYPAESRYKDDEGSFRGTLLLVVDRDTNGDDRLNQQDAKAIAIAALDGSVYRVIVEQIDEYHGQYVSGEDEVIVFFTQRATMTSAAIDLSTFSLRWSAPLRPE
jgi:hypothetical protein